jgi:glycosyltransferase involved in cell wall biosynthesis
MVTWVMTNEQPSVQDRGETERQPGRTGAAVGPKKRVLWLHTQPEHYHNLMLDELQQGSGYHVPGMEPSGSEEFDYIAAFSSPGQGWYKDDRPTVAQTVILRATDDRSGQPVGFNERYQGNWQQDLLGLNFAAAIVSGYGLRTFREFIGACRRRGIPVAMWSDSNLRSDRGRGAKMRLKRLVKQWYLRRLSGRVDYLLTANRRGEAYWRYYGGPAARHKIVICPCYSDYRRIDAAKQRPRGEVLGRIGLDAQDRYLFTAARLVRVKGLDLMIRAFREGGHEQRGWKYVIAGVGPLEVELKALAGASLGRSIFLIGFQQPPENLALMAHADLMVLPSRFEPHGIVVGEALSAGTPVLVSDIVGAAASLVEDGVNGRLFCSEDQQDLSRKLSVLEDPAELERLRAAARPSFEAWYRRTSPMLVVPRVVRAMLKGEKT